MSLETVLKLHDRIDFDSALGRSGADYNDLATRINDLYRHYEYMLLRHTDLLAATPHFASAMRAVQDIVKAQGPGTFPVTPEFSAAQGIQRGWHRRVEMEVESMLIFATMTLDRAAPFTQAFLGRGGREWKVFSSFQYVSAYATGVGASQPSADLLASIAWLTDNVTQIRHTYLAHGQEEKNARYSFGVWTQNDTGRVSFGHVGTFKPQPQDPQDIIQIWPEEVVEHMASFFEQWAAWLQENKGLIGKAPA